MRFKNPQKARGLAGHGHQARRPVPAGPGQRRPGAVRRGEQGAARAGGRGAGHGARPRVHRRAHRRVRGRRRRLARARLGDRSNSSAGCPGRRSRSSPTTSSRRDSVIVCWAMGLTQHRNAVATIREIVNFLLLRGNIGRPGAGAVPGPRAQQRPGRPDDGHLGEDARRASSTRCARSSASSRRAQHGLDTVDSIRAMRDGRVEVFIGPRRQLRRRHAGHRGHRGGAGPVRAHRARLDQAQPLAPAHGREALILPCLGRTERDVQASGEQYVTVEDSMSMVHASRGRLAPGVAAAAQRGRDRHRARRRAVRRRTSGGRRWARTTRSSGKHIERRGARLATTSTRGSASRAASCCPRPPRDSRTLPDRHRQGRTSPSTRVSAVEVPPGHLLLQTVRSHDQFNTTVYGLDDRYRGINGGRRVVFGQRRRPRASSASRDGDLVDLVSVWADGERRAPGFRWSSTRRPPGAPPRTSPRRTCWSRWTPPPRTATPRRRSRS